MKTHSRIFVPVTVMTFAFLAGCAPALDAEQACAQMTGQAMRATQSLSQMGWAVQGGDIGGFDVAVASLRSDAEDLESLRFADPVLAASAEEQADAMLEIVRVSEAFSESGFDASLRAIWSDDANQVLEDWGASETNFLTLCP